MEINLRRIETRSRFRVLTQAQVVRPVRRVPRPRPCPTAEGSVTSRRQALLPGRMPVPTFPIRLVKPMQTRLKGGLIAALGAFVHPLRLTFVEFYRAVGFAGGGRQYKPFTKISVIEGGNK